MSSVDLEKCPKCGKAWSGGEFCSDCGFVPVGAFLKAQPKKKKKKHRKYREPGGSTGFLSLVFLACLGYVAVANKVWSNNFQPIRELIQGPQPGNLRGTWTVVQSVIPADGRSEFARESTRTMTFRFEDDGKVAIDIRGELEATKASGTYRVEAQNLVLEALTFDPPGTQVYPDTASVLLSWSGPDALIATVGNSETLYLRRDAKADQPMQRLKADVSKYGESVLGDHGKQLRREMEGDE